VAHALLNCRACETPLTATLVDLGSQPVSNDFRDPTVKTAEPHYPLVVRVCPSCLLVQADHSIPADALFRPDYAYFSSYSSSWVEHARVYVEEMMARFKLGPQSLVAEVASNDGYLLQHFHRAGVPVLGIEPTANTAEAAVAKGIPTEVDFFSRKTATRLVEQGRCADLTAANNVLAHVPDIVDFLVGFQILMKPEGVATFEFPHLLNLMQLNQFDTIYHEHYSYLSLVAVEALLAKVGLRVFDVAKLSTHGGSLRLFVCQQGSRHLELASVQTLRDEERQAGLHTIAGYAGFEAKCQGVRTAFLAFLKQAQAQGKSVAAYGAAAKGNTFLNYCGVTARDVVCVADLSAAKQGKLLPGSGVPVVAPAELMRRKPDYVVVLPWNLVDEISGQLTGVRAWGGQFVTAIPALKVF
jgi:SAM-dependent methyltransferase